MRQKIRQHIGMALLIVVGIGMISHFLGLDMTFAADANQTNLLQDLQSKLNIYNIFMNVIYILLRPGLILAGMSLDNNMVYGAFFKLDAPLRVIRNIIKNFANFVLWFMVLVEVIKMVFNFWDDATSKITEVIKKCIIAGIGIQASWFLLAATIDVSTLATYGIGGLPLSVLGTSQDASIQCLANQKVLGVASTMDFTNSQQNWVANKWFTYYYYIDTQGGRKNYSPCELKDNYVIGRQYGWPANIGPYRETGDIFTQDNYCILGASKVVHFKNEIADYGISYGGTQFQNLITVDNANKYSINLQNAKGAINSTGNPTRATLQTEQAAFDINSGASFDISDGYGISHLYAIPVNGPGFEAFNDSGVLTMKKLLDSSKGMMWPLITLYSSILNFAQFNIQNSNGDDRALVIEALIKVLLALALFLPILLTALVMLVRVWILWVVIALSPFFVLKRSFSESMGELIKDIPILKYSPGELLKVIFAPVVIVFAVSLSIIFMSLLVSGFSNRGASNPCAVNTTQMYRSTFGVDEYIYATGQTLKVGNLFEISNQAFGNSTGGDARDYIGWILINLFGIGVVWMILMAALSFSEDLGHAIGVDAWKKWFINTIGSIPFVPVPTSAGMGFVWAKTFADVSSKALSNAADKASLNHATEQAFSDLALGSGEEPKPGTTTTTPSALNANQATAIRDAVYSGQDIGQIQSTFNPTNDATVKTNIDNKIAETIAQLAADKNHTFKDKTSIEKTIKDFRTIASNGKISKQQLKDIYSSDSNMKYALLPKDAEIDKEIKVWFGGVDDYLGITPKADGTIAVRDLDKKDIGTGTYKSLLDNNTRWPDLAEFIKDLEKKVAANPTHKTKRDAVKAFYNKP